jgi:hypothetical protein
MTFDFSVFLESKRSKPNPFDEIVCCFGLDKGGFPEPTITNNKSTFRRGIEDRHCSCVWLFNYTRCRGIYYAFRYFRFYLLMVVQNIKDASTFPSRRSLSLCFYSRRRFLIHNNPFKLIINATNLKKLLEHDGGAGGFSFLTCRSQRPERRGR